MHTTLLPATSTRDIALIRQLFEEYAASLRVELCFQGFAAELAALPGYYAPPRGRLFIAWVDDKPAGCVALRPHNATHGELKRLYVRPAYRQLGLGRKLATTIITEARGIGYESLLLDTLEDMEGALRLYASLGFVRRAPYLDSPLADNVFMELSLGRIGGEPSSSSVPST